MPLIDLSPKHAHRDLLRTQRNMTFNNADVFFSMAEWDTDGDIAPFGYYDINFQTDTNNNQYIWFTDNVSIWSKKIEFCGGQLSKLTIWQKANLTNKGDVLGYNNNSNAKGGSSVYYVNIAESSADATALKALPNSEKLSPIVDLEANGIWDFTGGAWVFTNDLLLLDYQVGNFMYSQATGKLYFIYDQGKIIALMYVPVDPTP